MKFKSFYLAVILLVSWQLSIAQVRFNYGPKFGISSSRLPVKYSYRITGRKNHYPAGTCYQSIVWPLWSANSLETFTANAGNTISTNRFPLFLHHLRNRKGKFKNYFLQQPGISKYYAAKTLHARYGGLCISHRQIASIVLPGISPEFIPSRKFISSNYLSIC